MTKPLRLAVDLSTIIAAIALTAMLAWHFSGQFKREKEVQSVRDGLRTFEKMLAVRAAAKDTPMTKTGWPESIDPKWFNGEAPLNGLLTPDRPWVEVATPAEAHLKDPNVRIASDYSIASFWYNPHLGIVRARVPYEINDENARDLYNEVNGTSVASIYGTELPRLDDVPYGPPAELADPGPQPEPDPNQ